MGLPSNTIYGTIQDKSGFVWIGTRDGLCRYDGRTFVQLGEIVPSLSMSGLVMAVEEDEVGKIWFSSSNGVGFYNPATDEVGKIGIPDNSPCFDIMSDGKGNVWFAARNLFRYDTANSGIHTYVIGESRPSMISVDSMGTIWVLLEDGSVYTYDRLKDTFNQQPLNYRVKIIEATEDGKMLVATAENEVYLIDCISLNGSLIFSTEGKRNVACFKEASKGEFWIGTDSGLFVRREGEKYMGEAFHDDATQNSISADFITCIDKDRDGNLWIGTYYTGLNIWRANTQDMAIYFANPSENSLKGKIVRDICADSKENIWFCTEDGWLNCLSPQDHNMDSFSIESGINMHGLVMDDEQMWICSYGRGLFLFDLNSKKVVKHFDFPGNKITSGFKTLEGDLYIGTTEGLYLMDNSTGEFSHFKATGTDFIHCIYQDSQGILWIGTYGNGILCIGRKGEILAHVTPREKGDGLSSRFITSFFEDSKHRMWVTTEGGGVCYTDTGYRIDDLNFSCISRADGLPSNITCSVAEDNDGIILVGTTNGIANISGENLEIKGLISYNNEVTGYQYSYGAVHSTRNGIIYFGNTHGMVALMPSMMKGSEVAYPICITSIEARNSDKRIKLNAPGKSAMNTSEIKVRNREASAISIGFIVPNYTTQNVLYHYTISRGKHNIFSGTTHESNVTFTGLRPGDYTFNVSVVGSGRADSAKSLDIIIMPPPLLSNLALTIYAAVIIIMIAATAWMLEAARKRDKARKLSKIASSKEKELYNAKINYFTNITHEIRTPLTLIKMPLDKLIAKGAYTPESEKDLLTIQANTDRLLSLINQLLDMRKMEQNEIRLSCTDEDICKIVRKTCGYFNQMFQDNRITC